MAYRLDGKRVLIELEDGPTIEVQPIVSDTTYRTVVGLGAAYFAATEPTAVQSALSAVATFFCREAMPTWDIADHHGPVPATPVGMLRFPDELTLTLASEWAAAFVAEPAKTAVDELVPEGPMRDALNRRLRAVA